MSGARPVVTAYQQGLAVINGLIGDWLHRRSSPLALPMTLAGKPADPADCQSRLCILVHGLTETNSIWCYPGQPDNDYGTLLADFEGFTPLYLHYNTGLSLAENGRLLADQLARTVADWPVAVSRLALIGHSMGGLVIRAACEQARQVRAGWLDSVSHCIYLGTPHLGAPLARLAHQGAGWLRQQELEPLQILGEVLDFRSSGICNLTDGCLEPLAPPSLVPGIRHFAISGSLLTGRHARTDEVPGDALVPRSSARGPQCQAWGLAGEAHFAGVGHLRLAHHSAVYLQIARWCNDETA